MEYYWKILSGEKKTYFGLDWILNISTNNMHVKFLIARHKVLWKLPSKTNVANTKESSEFQWQTKIIRSHFNQCTSGQKLTHQLISKRKNIKSNSMQIKPITYVMKIQIKVDSRLMWTTSFIHLQVTYIDVLRIIHRNKKHATNGDANCD